MTSTSTALHIHDGCFFNAYVNQNNIYKVKHLKMVVGSIAFRGWVEYGGKTWTLKDFKKRHSGYTWDAHCWLEDDKGNIYDYIHQNDSDVAEFRTGRSLDYTGVVEKKTRKWLKQAGLEYYPADAETQAYILANVVPYCEAIADAIATKSLDSMESTKAGLITVWNNKDNKAYQMMSAAQNSKARAI